MGTRRGREGVLCGIAAIGAAALAHCVGVPTEARVVAATRTPLAPTASALGASDATDAGVPDAASPDAGVASRAILRVGWIAGTASLFVVDAGGVSRVAPAGDVGGRCSFPSGASVIGVSDRGRVALDLGGQYPGEVGLLDVGSCEVRRTGIRASGEVSGGSMLSADGARLVEMAPDDATIAVVHELPSGRPVARCTTPQVPAGGPPLEVGLSARPRLRRSRPPGWPRRLAPRSGRPRGRRLRALQRMGERVLARR